LLAEPNSDFNPDVQEFDPVLDELDRKRIPYRLFQHPGQLHSLEQAAEERGQSPGQVVRSILFRCSGGSYVMVLAPGPGQISWPALRRHLGVSRVSMASWEEVFEQTGSPTGAVCPFGLPRPLRIIVDDSLFALDEVSLGSGIRYRALIMKTADLRRALGEVEQGTFLDQSPDAAYNDKG
jgi:prolyl-tRNA editing enzyme YbaK/EbsC (Cys-tRNA(Pro) deacylase)